VILRYINILNNNNNSNNNNNKHLVGAIGAHNGYMVVVDNRSWAQCKPMVPIKLHVTH